MRDGNALLIAPCLPEGHHQDITIGGRRGVDWFDRRHTVRDARIVDQCSIERIGEREVAELFIEPLAW